MQMDPRHLQKNTLNIKFAEIPLIDIMIQFLPDIIEH